MTKIKLSINEVKTIFKLRGYELITNEYLGTQQKLIIKDDIGYFYKISLNTFQTGTIPNKFHKSNPYTIDNIKLFCSLNNKQFKLISNTYVNTHKKLQWKCLKNICGKIFEMSWHDIHAGHGCSCIIKATPLNCLATINPVLASEWHPYKNGELTSYHVTKGSRKSIWWKCRECGHEWSAEVRDRNNGTGCPECNTPKGEKKCKEYFIDNKFIEIQQSNYDRLLEIDKNINPYFIPQKTFDGLLGVGYGLLSYDFYLPKYNLLIEYQGNYHDGTVGRLAQSEKDFKKQQEHDIRKKEYAIKNKYNFLEIWYYDYDNIEGILDEYLSKLENNLFIIN